MRHRRMVQYEESQATVRSVGHRHPQEPVRQPFEETSGADPRHLVLLQGGDSFRLCPNHSRCLESVPRPLVGDPSGPSAPGRSGGGKEGPKLREDSRRP